MDATWDEARWEAEFEYLMAQARKHLDPRWESGEVIVLRTVKGNLYTLEIPDFQDYTVRESLENQFIQTLEDRDDTVAFVCLATVNGKHPEIPSWNFRSRLVSVNSNNLDTETFLWGGGDVYLLKPFRSLLPPEKK